MEPSPLEISNLRLRLRALLSNPSGDAFALLKELADLGPYAEQFVPGLIAAMQAGAFMPSLELVPIIVRLKNAELLEAMLTQQDGRYPPTIYERCELLKAGFTQFERPLLDELFRSFERDNPPCAAIVEALAEAGSKAALETLEVIDHRIASRVPELRAELAGLDEDQIAERANDQIGRGEFWRWHEEFLQGVRCAIQRIRERPDFLGTPSQTLPETDSVRRLLARMEDHKLEFKAALRWDHVKAALDEELERRVLRAVAAFANASGGTLVIGVDPDHNVVGLRKDYDSLKGTRDRDQFERHLRQLLHALGKAVTILNVRTIFHHIGTEEVCLIQVEPSSEPVFIKSKEFYVRNGNANEPLAGEEQHKYIKERFRGRGE